MKYIYHMIYFSKKPTKLNTQLQTTCCNNSLVSSFESACLNYLDCGRTFPTKRKRAFSDGSWTLFLMIHMNCATERSFGTRNFLLSMSGT